jgi:hypothetical protein
MSGDHQPVDTPQTITKRLDIPYALEAAGLGVLELDPHTHLLNWDDRCRSLFGLARNDSLTYIQAICYIHLDDSDAVNQAVTWALNPARMVAAIAPIAP